MQRARVFECRGEVFEQDAFRGKVLHVADFGFDVFHDSYG